MASEQRCGVANSVNISLPATERAWLESRRDAGGFASTSDVVRDLIRQAQDAEQEHLHGEFHVPLWVVLVSHGAIALGTLMGGWRIVRTMGMHITKLRPVGGFCAETAGAITLFGATAAGIPVSTTHTITGSIIGVGVTSTRRLSAVKWGVAGRILWAWVLTMPMAALIAMLTAVGLRAVGWP